jgi:hypothetical protein
MRVHTHRNRALHSLVLEVLCIGMLQMFGCALRRVRVTIPSYKCVVSFSSSGALWMHACSARYVSAPLLSCHVRTLSRSKLPVACVTMCPALHVCAVPIIVTCLLCLLSSMYAPYPQHRISSCVSTFLMPMRRRSHQLACSLLDLASCCMHSHTNTRVSAHPSCAPLVRLSKTGSAIGCPPFMASLCTCTSLCKHTYTHQVRC